MPYKKEAYMKIYKNLLSGSNTKVILSLLKDEEMCGYQIIETLSNQLNYAFHLKEGLLYSQLHVLEKKEYISSRMLEVENGRKRKFYKITKKGKKLLGEKQGERQYYSDKLNFIEPNRCMQGHNENNNITDIYHWSYEASKQIRFKPDRDLVYRELLAHLSDKANTLESSGMKREDAMLATIESMGDVAQISNIMKKIHNPLSGYLLKISQVLLIISLLWISIFSFKNGGFTYIMEGLKPPQDYWEENQRAYNEDNAYELIAELTPNSTTTVDEYQLSVPKAYHRKLTYVSQGRQYEEESFHFILLAKHSPFLDAPKGILNQITAVDNLGNYYSDISGYRSVPSVVGNLTVERLFSSQFEMWIDGLSPNAEWIELQYDYLGRAFTLKIPTIEEDS